MAEKSKVKLNGFSLFMRERRPKLEEGGKAFPGGWKEVATHLDNEWKELTQDRRESYRQRAKKYDSGSSASMTSSSSVSNLSGDLRLTSLGNTYQSVVDQRNEQAIRLAGHHMELKRIMEHGDPKEVTLCIINFSIYGHLAHQVYIPAEMGITAFNVKLGIVDNYWTLIDPYTIPTGLGIEARQTAQRLGIPYPPFDNRMQDFAGIVSIIEQFLDRNMHYKVSQRKVFCMNSEMREVQGCLNWLYSQIQDKENEIELFSLGEAVRMLSNIGAVNKAKARAKAAAPAPATPAIQRKTRREVQEAVIVSTDESASEYYLQTSTSGTSLCSPSVSSGEGNSILKDVDPLKINSGVFFHEKQVEDFLNTLNFAYDGEIGCPYHLHEDEGLIFCPMNKTNRYAYNILDAMITTFGIIKPRPCHHIPSVRENPQEEAERRKELLGYWGNVINCRADLHFDRRMKPPELASLAPYLKTCCPK